MAKEKKQKEKDSKKKEEKKDEKKEDKKQDKKEDKKKDKKEDKKKDAKKKGKDEKKKDKKDEKKEEDEEEEVEVPKKFKDIVEEIEKMSVIDLSELVKILEKKFGVSAQPVAAAPAQGSNGEEKEEKEEKSVYDVELTETGSNKISVIKGIREFVSVGLKEAKEMADNAPKIVKNQVPTEDAEKMKKKLEDAGAKVTLK